jgi:hypothetical protein
MEPPPIKTDTPEVWPIIIHDLVRNLLIAPEHEGARVFLIKACQARDAFGREKYGVGLQVQNGRHPLRDAQDEALDCMAYTRQHFERVRASGAPRPAVLAAWQLHLAACAIGAMIANALMAEPT